MKETYKRNRNKLSIGKYILVMTCSMCPEQYDVFLDKIQVAYLRLRHGWFYASVPDCGDERVFESENMHGDGCFIDENERRRFLRRAIREVHKYYKEAKS